MGGGIGGSVALGCSGDEGGDGSVPVRSDVGDIKGAVGKVVAVTSGTGVSGKAVTTEVGGSSGAVTNGVGSSSGVGVASTRFRGVC